MSKASSLHTQNLIEGLLQHAALVAGGGAALTVENLRVLAELAVACAEFVGEQAEADRKRRLHRVAEVLADFPSFQTYDLTAPPSESELLKLETLAAAAQDAAVREAELRRLLAQDVTAGNYDANRFAAAIAAQEALKAALSDITRCMAEWSSGPAVSVVFEGTSDVREDSRSSDGLVADTGVTSDDHAAAEPEPADMPLPDKGGRNEMEDARRDAAPNRTFKVAADSDEDLPPEPDFGPDLPANDREPNADPGSTEISFAPPGSPAADAPAQALTAAFQALSSCRLGLASALVGWAIEADAGKAAARRDATRCLNPLGGFCTDRRRYRRTRRSCPRRGS